MLKQRIKQIKSGKLTAVKNVMQFGKKIEKLNKELNIFLIRNEEALNQAKEIDKRIKQGKQVGKLAGLCCAIKSNICVQGLTTNCASHVLENFVAPYNATVINKLKAEDEIILGMANMDEFACGSSGESSFFGATKNPTNPQLIPGGTSSGSAAAVSANLCDFALGSDTGGSIRNPASHCGVTGMKPTYGSVSRYGLIDMTMSFDQIGPLTKTPEDAQLIFNIIKGQDNFDSTTVDIGAEAFYYNSREASGGISIQRKNWGVIQTPRRASNKPLTIGLVDVKKFCNPEIAQLIETKTREIANQNNWKIKKVQLPLDIALETYYIIVYTEFFSTSRKFDSRRFGLSIDKEAGPEVIRRILGGSEISKAEYHGKFYRNALKACNYIKQQFQKIFNSCDVLILPTVPKLPHKIGEKISIEEMYSYDVLTVPASIAGLPGISVPAGEIDGKAVGLQVVAPWWGEDLMFKVAGKFENEKTKI